MSKDLQNTRIFAARTENLEIAYVWLKQLLGREGEKREHDGLGGDYYLFRGDAGAQLLLVNNSDAIDDEPIFADVRYKVVVNAAWNGPNPEMQRLLNTDPDHFLPVEEL